MYDIGPINIKETFVFGISIYQIGGLQFSRVLIGSSNLEYPWIFPVLRTERKLGRRFAKVSEEEIVAINEAAFFYPSGPSCSNDG